MLQNITPDEDSTATDMELGTLQESFDVADHQNEEKADITPDEDSTATDMELSVLQESHDAAEDRERPDALAPDQQIWGSVLCSFCNVRKEASSVADCDVCGLLFCFRGQPHADSEWDDTRGTGAVLVARNLRMPRPMGTQLRPTWR